jgi:hypothetical protein
MESNRQSSYSPATQPDPGSITAGGTVFAPPPPPPPQAVSPTIRKLKHTNLTIDEVVSLEESIDIISLHIYINLNNRLKFCCITKV